MFCVVWDLLKLKSEEQCNQKVAKLKSKFPVILSNNTREHACHVPATPTPNEKPLGNSWACRKTTIGGSARIEREKWIEICFQWNFCLMRCFRYDFLYLNFCTAFYTSFASLSWFWAKLTRRLSMSSAKVKKGKIALSRTWLASSPELVLWNKWRAS